MHRERSSAVCRLNIESRMAQFDSVQLRNFDDFLFFLGNKRRLLSLREARQEVLYRGSDDESHLDNSEALESWLFV